MTQATPPSRSTATRRIGVASDAFQGVMRVNVPAIRPRPVAGGWRFAILVEMASFAVLRRHVGRPRADTVIQDIADRTVSVNAALRVAITSRETIEIAFEGEAREDLDPLLTEIENALQAPFDIDGEVFTIDIVLGAAVATAFECDEVRLIEEAERAIADARIERTPVVREVGRATSAFDRITLRRDLTMAISNEELFLQYQPKVHLRRQEVSSLEALVRWKHPTRGLILPGDFIPIAEESRDIVSLTLWTIQRSIIDQRTLSAHGYHLPIFINIAGVLLSDTRFVRRACALVKESNAQLGFEITETSVIRDPEIAISHLRMFADIGVTVAIDDYGAGLSSLAYLKKLPARELKIDKLFVTQLSSSNRDPLIVRSTIDLAHALEMEVVAEGVETQAAMALLSVMGCDMVQGFLISRPIGIEALLTFLSENRHLIATQGMHAPFGRLAAVWKRG